MDRLNLSKASGHHWDQHGIHCLLHFPLFQISLVVLQADMHTLGEIAEVWNGLEEISLDQRDVVELRSARRAGLSPIWIQKHLKYTQRGGRNQSKWGKFMFFYERNISKSC